MISEIDIENSFFRHYCEKVDGCGFGGKGIDLGGEGQWKQSEKAFETKR